MFSRYLPVEALSEAAVQAISQQNHIHSTIFLSFYCLFTISFFFFFTSRRKNINLAERHEIAALAFVLKQGCSCACVVSVPFLFLPSRKTNVRRVVNAFLYIPATKCVFLQSGKQTGESISRGHGRMSHRSDKAQKQTACSCHLDFAVA